MFFCFWCLDISYTRTLSRLSHPSDFLAQTRVATIFLDDHDSVGHDCGLKRNDVSESTTSLEARLPVPSRIVKGLSTALDCPDRCDLANLSGRGTLLL